MSSAAISTVVKMMESLPVDVQERVAEHLREYIDKLQDEIRWNQSFQRTQHNLIAAAKRAKQEISEGQATVFSAENFENLYETDFYAWTQQQANFLQEKKWNSLDIPNLIEEIESLGKQQRQELRNRLGVLLGHLLKWEFQSNKRSRSWFRTIREQRSEILELIYDSPSLKPYQSEALEKAYQKGLDLAVDETYLDYKIFPKECPYSLENVLDSRFFPGEPFDFKQWGFDERE